MKVNQENLNINKQFSKKMLVVLKKFPFAYCLFFYLSNNMDSDNSFICSKKDIEVELKHDEEHIDKAIELLSKLNFIEVKNIDNEIEKKNFIINSCIVTLK